MLPSVSNLLTCTELRRDYAAMSGMIFGRIPTVDQVVEAISELEHLLNGNADSA